MTGIQESMKTVLLTERPVKIKKFYIAVECNHCHHTWGLTVKETTNGLFQGWAVCQICGGTGQV